MQENHQGAITEVFYLVLLATFQPRHGYGIIQFISEHTGGRLTLGAGTLYGALNTLVHRGWIALISEDAISTSSTSSNFSTCSASSSSSTYSNSRRKDYRITVAGREVVNSEIQRYQTLSALGLQFLGEGLGNPKHEIAMEKCE